jgi:hypothetical protein
MLDSLCNILAPVESLDEMIDLDPMETVVFLPTFPRMVRVLYVAKRKHNRVIKSSTDRKINHEDEASRPYQPRKCLKDTIDRAVVRCTKVTC